MDILNWVYLLKNRLIKKEVQDPTQDLVILGSNVSFTKRGDKYQSYGMTVEDFANSLGGGLEGESYILVKGDSDDPAVNGAELKAAYDIAAASTPYGIPRSNNNTFTIIIAPGTYDMTAYNSTYGWELTAPYINLRGLTANYDADKRTDVQISTFCANAMWCEYTGLDTNTYFGGQILIGSTGAGASSFTNCHAGPYSFGTGTQGAFGLSCAFKDCSAGNNSFGSCVVNTVPFPYITPPGSDNTAYITIYRSFENCTAGPNSFGATNSGTVSVSASFKNCTANGGSSFGAALSTGIVDNNGTYTDCTANGNNSFGYSQAGDVTVNGTFTNCLAYGYSFGCSQGNASNVTIGGRFYDCRLPNGGVGSFSFGVAPSSLSGSVSIIPKAIFENCTAGYISFGSGVNNVTVAGTFTNCTANGWSFGWNSYNYNATASGTFTDCTVSFAGGPGDGAFGGITASGVFRNCSAINGLATFGYGSFFDPGYGGTASGSFYNCVSSSPGAFGTNATGTFINCKADQQAFGYADATGGSFYNCIAGAFSFGAQPVGNLNATFINCVGGYNSFGNNDGVSTSTLSGKAFYCVKNVGSFYASVGGTKAVLCIDDTNTIKTL
jgi:hypothetical protein